MFKILLFVKRKAGLTREQFIDYYESRHVHLVRSKVPAARLYRRNYVREGAQVSGIVGASTAALGFDCVTEIGFATRAEAEEHIAAYLDPAINPTVVADENNFIEPGGLTFVLVEPHQTADYSG
jgi:hypothetical protein